MKYIYYNLMPSNCQNSIHISAIAHQKQLYLPILLPTEKILGYLSDRSIIETPENIDNAHVRVTNRHIKTLFFSIILIVIALSAFLVLSAKFKIYQDVMQIGRFRNLEQIGSGQSRDSAIDVRSKDDVPRWFNYQPQESADLQPNPSRTFVPSILSPKKDEFDVIGVIFQNNANLNFEIAAGITGEKLKLATKLLSLNRQKNEYQQQIYDFERQYYQQRYNISAYPELPICAIVPTYNNAENQRYKQNLESIMKQQYQNYKVIIIDDNSQDSTGTYIQKLISDNNLNTSKYILIKNAVQMKAMHNIRTAAAQYCDPKDIMIIVDGDDQLIGRQVFNLYNAVFQKENVWFVYSNFIDVNNKNLGYSREFPQQTIQTNSFRYYLFFTSHLRAFYTSLFLQIQQKDLKDTSGRYFQAANDVAICIPILEMSHERIKYIPEITYGYNSNTGSNNHLLKMPTQQANDRQIRKKEGYRPLEKLW